MNGMKKVDDSKGKKSVEGFLTFLYHFVVPGLQAAQAVKDFAQKGSKGEHLVLVFLGGWFWNHCSVIRQNLLQSILMRMTHTFAAWLPLQVWPGWKCVWFEDSQPSWKYLGLPDLENVFNYTNVWRHGRQGGSWYSSVSSQPRRWSALGALAVCQSDGQGDRWSWWPLTFVSESLFFFFSSCLWTTP